MQLVSLVVGIIATVYVVSSTSNRGLARFLAPEVIAILMLFSIFSIRPMFNDRFAELTFYGYIPTPAGEHTALMVGTVCMTFFALGCFLASVRPAKAAVLRDRRPPEETRTIRLSATRALVIACAGAVLYVLLLLAVAGSGTVAALSGGRSQDVAIGGVPEFVLIVPMTGSIVATLFVVSRRDSVITRREALLCLCAVAVSLVLLSQLGNRRFLIPAALMPIIAILVRRTLRVRAYHVVIALVAFLFIAIVPMVRSAGARMPGENLLTASWRYLGERGIAGVLTPVFASYDTEMLDYIAFMSQKLTSNSGIGFGLGRGTVVEFFLRPLPSSVTGMQYSDQLLASVWGGGCGQPVCPVASVAGVLFFEGGVVAVAIGSFAFALALRFLSNRLAFSRSMRLLPLTCVTVVSAFALIATRTNTVHSLWWTLYAIVLTLVVHRMVSTRIRPVASALTPGPGVEGTAPQRLDELAVRDRPSQPRALDREKM